jgi:hypothetical protein
MDAPPAYDEVAGRRSSSSISAHSNDPIIDDAAAQAQARQAGIALSDRTGNGISPESAEEQRQKRLARQKQEGGCLNFGQNVDGCE